MNPEEGRYRKIKIQELESKPQPPTRPLTEAELVQNMDKDNEHFFAMNQDHKRDFKIDLDIICFMDNGNKERLFSPHNQFAMFLLHPYNFHGNILLVPDDIWMLITQFLSRYVVVHEKEFPNRFRKQGAYDGIYQKDIPRGIGNHEEM